MLQEDIQLIEQITQNIERAIIGKRNEIKLLLTALLAEGHVLIEDVPGTGKTALIKSLAQSIAGNFSRIQCNPDLLPTDITGVSIYHPKYEDFIFRPGPVMTNILLVDEINRATTKTQSALLEIMEEKSVTNDGESHDLPRPFLLLATQNPIDFEGTYMLPEAQLDRFMFKFSLGYPTFEAEKEMVVTQRGSRLHEPIGSVTNVEAILKMQSRVKLVHLDDAIVEYIVKMVRSTRKHFSIYLGASPRATIAMVNASKAYAYLQGRNYVIPDDAKWVAPYVLGHRVILQAESRMQGETAKGVIESILSMIEAPVRIGTV